MRVTNVILDTSAFNHLAFHKDADALVSALEYGFCVIPTADSFDELCATPRAADRLTLFRCFNQLFSRSWIIAPAAQILRRMVGAHADAGAGIVWSRVKIDAPDYESAVGRIKMDDSSAASQCADNKFADDEFEAVFAQRRTPHDEALRAFPEERPANFSEAIGRVQEAGSGFAQLCFEWASGNTKTMTGTDVNALMNICPPLRAHYYSLIIAWYNWSLSKAGRKKKAQGSDLLMSVYLPYCDLFVTDDRPQLDNLREIAKAAAIDCEVILFLDFLSRLGILETDDQIRCRQASGFREV